MKQIIKSALVLALALVMALSSLVIVAAESVPQGDNDSSTAISASGDSTREFELVWRYQRVGNHLYKRRWNMTLGLWYDPEWILVY